MSPTPQPASSPQSSPTPYGGGGTPYAQGGATGAQGGSAGAGGQGQYGYGGGAYTGGQSYGQGGQGGQPAYSTGQQGQPGYGGAQPQGGYPGASPAASPGGAGAMHRVPDTGLPAWAAPDPSRPPVANLAPHLELRVAERAGDWARVVASNGWSGWVDGRRLIPTGR